MIIAFRNVSCWGKKTGVSNLSEFHFGEEYPIKECHRLEPAKIVLCVYSLIGWNALFIPCLQYDSMIL